MMNKGEKRPKLDKAGSFDVEMAGEGEQGTGALCTKRLYLILYINTLITTYLRTQVRHGPQQIMYPVYGDYKLSLQRLIHIFLLIHLIKSFATHDTVY